MKKEDEDQNELGNIFNLKTSSLSEGLSYLGFRLKPLRYSVKDWKWLPEKFEKKINLWSLRWLSRGGRLILSQAVLQQYTVYWAHIFVIPK